MVEPALASPKTGAKTNKKKSGPSLWRQIAKNKTAYLFIMPKAIFFIVFTAIPVIWAFILAFQKYNILIPSEWIGLDNFRRILESGIYPIALKNTLKYTVIAVPASIFMALGLATLIHPLSEKSQTFYRSAFYLPGVASTVVTAMIWRYLYSPTGLINTMLHGMGHDPIPFLNSSNWALWSVIIMGIITPPGAGIIYYLAAMGSIPKDLYEAAEIDGANGLRQWWHITLPLLKPTTFYLTLMSTIGSLQVFSSVLLLTQGGPGHATKTLTYLIWESAFSSGRFDFGYASAQAIVLFLMILGLGVIQHRVLRSDDE